MDLPGGYTLAVKAAPADLSMAEWWRGFHDRGLNGLVDRGLAQNLGILQALERVRAAEASARGSGVVLNSALDVSVERSGGPELVEATETDGTFGVSWLIDLFGEARRDREAAAARVEAAYADTGAARTVFLSNLASAYVSLRFFEESIALRRRDLTSRRRTASEVRTLLDSGSATQLDLGQAEALIAVTEAQIPLLQAGAVAQRNRIATLLGVPAGTLGGLGTGSQPVPGQSVRAGVPADLVRNRPDVRRAERLYAAAVADVGVATADLYPSLVLGGSLSATHVNGNGTVGWSFGPALNLPIFDQGLRRSRVSVAESAARGAYLAWKQAVLSGVEEVESSLASIGRSAEAVAASRRAVSRFESNLDLSRQLAASGEATILDVIDAERSVSEARATLASNIRQLALDYITLNVALGAGWATGPQEVVTSSLAEPTPPVTVPTTYKVAKGETLYDVAAAHDTTVQALAELNGIGRPYQVSAGQSLKLPLQTAAD